MTINEILCQEFHLKPAQCENVLRLIDEGNTIPFIARYRKEQTGSLDDQVLREIMSEDPVPDARDVCPDVPAEVAVLIRRMCVKNRARRLQDFNAVLAELGKLAAP